MSWLGDIDCREQAERAMKMAAATTGLDRARWVRIAVAWHELAGAQLATGHTEEAAD